MRRAGACHSQTLARRHSACSLHSGVYECGGVQLAGQGALSSAPRPRRCRVKPSVRGESRFRTEIKIYICLQTARGAQQPLRPPPRCARAPREVYTFSLVGPTLSLSTSAAPRQRGGDAAPQRGRLARRGCRRRCAAQRRALAAPRTLPRMKSAHGCLAAVWGGRPLIKREEHSDGSWKGGRASRHLPRTLVCITTSVFADSIGRLARVENPAPKELQGKEGQILWQTEGGEIAACRSLKGMASPMLA